MEKKGSVTSLSSVFPADEAHKASARVNEAVAESQRQLAQLGGFIADNTNLINLVQKLPDETHHDIMVPFGKAAFFPGRLIHTNEFMVLLGEGYYAERTCKQTIEILKRRGNALEAQIESVKAVIKDLRAEASFFDATASESAEGLVEIREEYVEEGSSGNFESPANVRDESTAAAEDDEYSRIFARMDELEREEEASMAINESMLGEQNITTKEGTVHSPEDITKGMEELSTGLGETMGKALEKLEEKEKVRPPPVSSGAAFTGSIVERRTQSIERNSDERGEGGGARSPRPVSRFKMQKHQQMK